MTELNYQEPYQQSNFLGFMRSFLPHFEQNANFEEPLDLPNSTQFATEAYLLGEEKKMHLLVLEIHHCATIAARVGIAKDANRLLQQYACQRALIAFIPDGTTGENLQWRFSLVYTDVEFKGEDSGALRHIHSDYHRLSYLLGVQGNYSTPQKFLCGLGPIDGTKHKEGQPPVKAGTSWTDWDDLKYRFSVEALTKQFYTELFDWYLWATDSQTGVTFPNNPNTPDDDRDNIQIKIIRLITRLMFVWFIKQKHLVPNNLFDPDFLKTILRDFQTGEDKGVYYNAILQNLFFATLNQEVSERRFARHCTNTQYSARGIKYFYRDDDKKSYFRFDEQEKEQKVLQLFETVPYLNGGLFNCLDVYKKEVRDGKNYYVPDTLYDGFSSNSTIKSGHYVWKAFLPDALFFAPERTKVEVTNGSQKEKLEVCGLIRLFQKYNFTVEENSPSEQQVALDPELLGKVFENLLAAYNPETQVSARNETGSFYTPREVVNYMTDEALRAYLEGKGFEKELVENLLHGEGAIKTDQNENLINALESVKILDPAVGSGAFPMGMLLKMTEMIARLTPDEQFNRYQTKLRLIQNCLYGGDIQAIALLICRLRFFISLICEQGDHVEALPSLDLHFVAANSLLQPAIRTAVDASEMFQDEKLLKIQQELLDLRNRMPKNQTEKLKLLDQDDEKRQELSTYLHQMCQPNEKNIADLKKDIAKYRQEIEALPVKLVRQRVEERTMFGESKVYYQNIDLNASKRRTKEDCIRECEKKIDVELHKNRSELSKAVEELAAWNPHDQTRVSPFLDAKWMFGFEKFDIVIGNPPYVQLQGNGGELGAMYKNCGFETFARTGDLYCLFYEQGMRLLKEGGHLCYITSSAWMIQKYGTLLRGYFSQYDPKLLIALGKNIFESATVATNILLIKKEKNQQHTLCAKATATDRSALLSNMTQFIHEREQVCAFDTSDLWSIQSEIEKSILTKMQTVGVKLEDWEKQKEVSINFGIKTGCDEAFILDTAQRNAILAACETEDERKRTEQLIRPILQGKDVKFYRPNWADRWVIGTHNGIKAEGIPPIDIEDYPAVLDHLNQYWDTISVRDDQGVTPYNLRNCAYWRDFEKEKIVWKTIGRNLAFALVEPNVYMGASGHIIVAGKRNKWLLAFLRSTTITYFIYQYASRTGMDDIMCNKLAIERIPIPLQPTPELEEAVQADDADAIDKAIYNLYGFTQEEVDFMNETIKKELAKK